MTVIKLSERRMEYERNKFKGSVEKQIEESVRKNKVQWSEMCYMPVQSTFDEVKKIFLDEEELQSKDINKTMTDLYKNASMIAAFSGWRKNNNKVKTGTLHEDNPDIPFMVNANSIFQRTGLGLYIDCEFKYAPYLGCDFIGAMVHINHTFLGNPNELELRVYFLTEDKKDCFPCNVLLLNGKTLSTCLCETLGIDKNDIIVDGHVPSLSEIDACTDSYQRSLLAYKLRYKIFKDLFSVLFSQ